MYLSRNPATEEIIKEFPQLSDAELEAKLSKADAQQRAWADVSFSERATLMKKGAELFRAEKEDIGKIISSEMGRPFSAAITEAEKCAWVMDYYADGAEKMLSPQPFPEGAGDGEVRFDPLGIIFAVMPWNYPFWQVMRFAAPALMAGNAGVLKHASNVPQSASYVEDILRRAGFPEGLFQNLFISREQSGKVIDDPRIVAVTLTGSVGAGSVVGERAGRNLKKLVLELGGSDPFIVLSDADVSEAAKVGALARLQNAGQTCIAAKRFIVEAPVYDAFVAALTEEFKKYVIGNPLDTGTLVGPLATSSIVEDVEAQVKRSVELGAEVRVGGTRPSGKGYFFMPTILTNVAKGMPAYDEEIFGPVASVIKVQNEAEAVTVANDTEFGLSSSLWTKDIERAKRIAVKINAGGVFINAMTKSDPRIPFGGVKKSGHGRELAEFGIREFVNVKTVSIANKPTPPSKEDAE